MSLTIKQIETALIQKDGNISEAAKGLGVTRQALHLRIQQSMTLQTVIKDAREGLCDLAESASRQQIREGNTAIIIFTLKTLGKERGYVERNEITGKEGGPISAKVEHVIDSDTAGTIFDILARVGAIPSASDDAEDDEIHST